MFHVLIDTSVWLDLAQDPKLTPLLLVVENMVREKALALVVPRVVVDEFQRNRARVAKASSRSLAGHFQQVKEAVNKVDAEPRKKKALLAQLDDLNHKIPLIGGAAEGVLERIAKLLNSASVLEASDPVTVRAAERALKRKAPCHVENKNSIADAIVLEIYFDAVKMGSKGDRFAFVTHNKTDFSLQGGNQKLPHADIAAQFTKIKSMYFINLADLLRRIDPSLLSELVWEQTYSEEPRGLSEILKAEDLLFHQVWYNRHMNLRWAVKNGKIKIVSHDDWVKLGSNNSKYIVDSVYDGAKRAAADTRRRYGPKNFGPWSDFEWGMVNGKLSALRWVLGDEWDMLDT
jgi:hypothetical protein